MRGAEVIYTLGIVTFAKEVFSPVQSFWTDEFVTLGKAVYPAISW